MNYKLSVDLRCNGVYSYRIVDPMLFYTNVCGNVEDTYERSEIDEMLRTCSRLVVMRDRKVVGELSGDDLNQTKIMATIAGGEN